MYCSVGAPLGLVVSEEGSWRPWRPNHDPPLTRKSAPFLVMLPFASTRNCAWPVWAEAEKIPTMLAIKAATMVIAIKICLILILILLMGLIVITFQRI